MVSRRDTHRDPASVRAYDRDELHGPGAEGDGGSMLADALSINAVFSAASGLILLAGAPLLNGWFGVDGRLLAAVGGGLIVFASLLIWLLARPRRLAAGARWVLAADLGWIVGAVTLLTTFPSALSDVGTVALAAVTGVVVLIVAGQLVGLRRHGSGSTLGSAPIALRVERTISASTDRVWDAVSDAGDYARFAPGIAATRLVGLGQGMVRVCRDDRGGEWAETCTLWDPGHGYRMSVDVESYPAYYRLLLAEFAQTWTLEPVAEGTHVRLCFDSRVKLGIIGRFVVSRFGNPGRLEAILDGYERELTEGASTVRGSVRGSPRPAAPGPGAPGSGATVTSRPTC